jgi:hypothetical protein
VDRPDDVSGPQIHAIYVLPSDGADFSADTDGGIDLDISNWNDWLEKQTGGRTLRIDTYQGQADVSFVRLSETGAAAKANGGTALSAVITNAVIAAGFVDAGKRYAVYYGGPAATDVGGNGGPYAGSGYGILHGVNPPAAQAGSRFAAGMLHEVIHSLGFVPSCAPHEAGGHVTDDQHDIMYAGGGNAPNVLDAGHDDYYGAHIPGCPDLSDSPYLTTLPHYSVSVTIKGHGSAEFFPGDLTCTAQSPCKTSLRSGETTYVGATAGADSYFVGWSGACSGTAETCQPTVTGDSSTTAQFALNPRLVLHIRGAGAIRIVDTGHSTAARCLRDCAPRFSINTRLVLRAVPRAGFRFTGWGGKCSGAHGCTVTLATADARVTATFLAPRCAKGQRSSKTHPCRQP